jgi:hypothetical protein
MATQEIIVREFTREMINVMGEHAFVAMHEHSEGRVDWNEYRDTLVFVFTDTAWCWLVLKYPELLDMYLRDE